MKFTNYRVSAGRAAAILKKDLIGLNVIAPTGYMSSSVQERIGLVLQLRPDRAAPEVAFQFQWADEEGTADIGVFKNEPITLCLSPEQLHLIERLEA
ncbi:hypothetical protein [Rheinheimera sp.]|uniref:hypothetical protein n=1 Tax=Rheinheimera sp. TaxID=1869214 RepID=UPI00262A1BB0|nr:hypothetical protein [Rheinheimera sp.]MCA1930914.1 hypothetical protein [Rheinheimera sp.]